MRTIRVGSLLAAVTLAVGVGFTAAPTAALRAAAKKPYTCTTTRHVTNGNSSYRVTQVWVVFGKKSHLSKPTKLTVTANQGRSRSLYSIDGEYVVDGSDVQNVHVSHRKYHWPRTMSATFTSGIAQGKRYVEVVIVNKGKSVLKTTMKPCK